MFMLVDQNEQATNPEVIRRLKHLFPNLQIANLQFGDINIILDNGDILAIERKRARDFLGSIGDGRVFRQVEEMHAGAKWCCIVIEGRISFDKDDMTLVDGLPTKWRGKSVRAAYYAIQWSGCPMMTSSKETFASVVQDLVEFCCKPEIHHQTLGHKRIVTFPPLDLEEEILAAFPGVGHKRARSLRTFAKDHSDEKDVGSLAQSLVWATTFPLIDYSSRPQGWGDKLVQNFRATLGLAPDEYLEIKEDSQKNGSKGRKKNAK